MGRILRIAEMYHWLDADADDDTLTTTVAGYTATPVASSLVIPVTHAYVAKTGDTATEALTLANGVPGQILQITLVATGGANTITPATMTGFATIVLTTAGDFCTLLYVDDAIGWMILGMGGAAATPVVS
jgi:hypothetical protein